jgi:hypothetical protein
MKRPVSFRALAVIVALGAVVTLGVVSQTKTPRKARIPSNIVLVSNAGERLPSFFDGLDPVKGYVNGKMYKKNRTQPNCGKKASLLERFAITLGLERVAKAQGGCEYYICNGCYTKIVGRQCSGACEGTYFQNESGDPACYAGFVLNGPSCNVDDGCGCNSIGCDNGGSCGPGCS